MATQLYCPDNARAALIRSGGTLNGIDYLQVLDREPPIVIPPQQTLLVHCFLSCAGLDERNVRIDGGVRVRGVRAVWAKPASDIVAAPGSPPASDEPNLLATLQALSAAERPKVLVVRTDRTGDYSTYTLRLVRWPRLESGRDTAPDGYDPLLSSVNFGFKVECPSEFDCATTSECAAPVDVSPQIDYLAKDYASFRRLMLDRLSILVPAWKDRNAADVGIAAVEVLAYAADHLSYFQDAVATEAYLGTARRRASVRRHARLVDYLMHDGVNARAWVTFEVVAGGGAEGAELPTGTQFLTRVDGLSSVADSDPDVIDAAVDAGAIVFETMHPVTLRAAHSEIHFHTWGDPNCCLPKGATRATLRQRTPNGLITKLDAGDKLIFEEIRAGSKGIAADADRTHRHVVRLTSVRYTTDPAFKDAVDPTKALGIIEIEWSAEDALSFPLCLHQVVVASAGDPHHGTEQPTSVARGNVVLADHGRTLPEAEDPDKLKTGGLLLKQGPVTQQGRLRALRTGRLVPFDPESSAFENVRPDLRDAMPAITLSEGATSPTRWTPQRDLLASDEFAAQFVVEVEDSGRTHLRFGDGIHGRTPVKELQAIYRVGSGVTGNVGADAIAHLVRPTTGVSVDSRDIRLIRNPLPATGGTDPESTEHVRLYAPQAFRRQERAVTEEDYAAVTERHREVQRAVATRRWTGSWYTMFVTVDRRGGAPVDAAFETRIRAHLERFRMAGHDVEIDAPRLIPLDIALTVCVAPGHTRSNVKRALLEVFSTGTLRDGRRGFFHPDYFTFGQPVYLSQIIAAAMRVEGVAWVKATRFQRWREEALQELADGQITMGRLEIAQLENDVNAPEGGRIEFDMQGGL